MSEINKMLDALIDDFRYVVNAYLDLNDSINSLDINYEKMNQIKSIHKKYFESE